LIKVEINLNLNSKDVSLEDFTLEKLGYMKQNFELLGKVITETAIKLYALSVVSAFNKYFPISSRRQRPTEVGFKGGGDHPKFEVDKSWGSIATGTPYKASLTVAKNASGWSATAQSLVAWQQGIITGDVGVSSKKRPYVTAEGDLGFLPPFHKPRTNPVPYMQDANTFITSGVLQQVADYAVNQLIITKKVPTAMQLLMKFKGVVYGGATV